MNSSAGERGVRPPARLRVGSIQPSIFRLPPVFFGYLAEWGRIKRRLVSRDTRPITNTDKASSGSTRARPGAAGWRASELPQAESRCAHTSAPGQRAVHGERGAAAVPPLLKREAVRTSESHPISLPPSLSLHVVPSIRRPVRPSVPLPSLPPSFFRISTLEWPIQRRREEAG